MTGVHRALCIQAHKTAQWLLLRSTGASYWRRRANRQRHRKRSRNFAALTGAKASSDPTCSPYAAAIGTSRLDRIQMNNLRGVKGPVVRRFIPLAPPSVVLRIVLIRPAAVPVYRRWDCGSNPRFAGACNVDGIGQGSRSCISKSGIFRSPNIERQPIRIKSTHQQREIIYV